MRPRRLMLLAVVLSSLAASVGRGEPTVIRAAPGTLEHYLASRLLVTNPTDAAFLEEVAEAVRSGDLPESLVRGTCEWAAVRAILICPRQCSSQSFARCCGGRHSTQAALCTPKRRLAMMAAFTDFEDVCEHVAAFFRQRPWRDWRQAWNTNLCS